MNESVQFFNTSDAEAVDSVYEFAHGTEAWSKLLWRFDFLTCPKNNAWCASKVARNPINRVKAKEKCSCVCDRTKMKTVEDMANVFDVSGVGEQLEFYDNEGNPINKFVSSASGLTLTQLQGYGAAETLSIYTSILDKLCDVGFIGTMFQVGMLLVSIVL